MSDSFVEGSSLFLETEGSSCFKDVTGEARGSRSSLMVRLVEDFISTEERPSVDGVPYNAYSLWKL